MIYKKTLLVSVKFVLVFSLVIHSYSSEIFGQSSKDLKFLDIPEKVEKKRLIWASGTAALSYTGSMIALNKAWYEDYPKTSLHTFNDWGEWENMDKAGHIFSAYFETGIAFQLARWVGLNNKQSALTAFGVSTIVQGSIELMDGYSSNWGWSWHDIAANTLGSTLYSAQQLIWEEQRMRMKFSYTPIKYSSEKIKAENGEAYSSILDRAEEQFGTSPAERVLKDYAAQTIWLSINPHSFLNEKSRFPSFLNIAVGYGANNVIGAYGNVWFRESLLFRPTNFEREKQIYLSLDIDLRKVKTKNIILRKVLNTINIIKIPSPTLEINSNGNTNWHWIYF